MNKKILCMFVMTLLMIASTAFVSSSVFAETTTLNLYGLDFGDAPEGPAAIAYPSTGTFGSFPTCMSSGPSTWIQHYNFGAFFGPTVDFEPDGNGGTCPGGFPPYDQDECFNDGDAGLIMPDSYSISTGGVVIPCPGCVGTPLGVAGQTARWGIDIDIDVHNHMPSATIGYVNILIDWNQNGQWGDPGEHVLVNSPIPNPFDGALSSLHPSSFTIGQNFGYVWARFSITESQVPSNWIGDGLFEDGESEDYLLQVLQGQNSPPLTPSTPSGPTSGVTGTTYTYTTSTTDPDGDTIRYGWDTNGDSIVDYWSYLFPSGSTCPVYIVFNSPGTYVLSVIAEDIHGAQSSFSQPLTVTITQGSNQAPLTPSTPNGPSSGSIGVSYSYSTSTTDPDGDNVKYGWDWDGDGTVDEWTSFYTSGTTISTSHSWSSSGTYNIKVKAEDSNGAQSSFSQTLGVTIACNNPPSTPTLSGPSSGKVGVAYTYSATSTDPDGDQIYYWFDWGDGTNTGWIGPYMSGMTANTAHIFTSKGTYAIKVKVKDDPGGLESSWETMTVSMPKTKNEGFTPLGLIIAYGFDVDVKFLQLEPGEDYVDLEVLNKPFYLWHDHLQTINPGAFIRLYSAKGFFSPSSPFCLGICDDWGIIG